MRQDGPVNSDGPAILAGTDGPLLHIPDGYDIFKAEFARDGDDLTIAAAGSPPLTVVEYFTVSSPPALVAPNGSMLTGDVVELLAGPRAPAQYAQADTPEGATPIGKVEVLTGTTTATRTSGEVVELAQDDPVFQGDVLQTGDDSTLGIRLEDGTLASMSAQSRLVLNEFVYEADGSDNWMVVNLVEGAFAFLTGAIAPSGGMEITTPVAVMAIRGTMPIAIVAQDGASQFFAGSDENYELLHLTTRELLAVINSGVGYALGSADGTLETIDIDPETLEEINNLLDVLNDAAASLGFLGIMADSGFHSYSKFGSIGDAGAFGLLQLLAATFAEEAVIDVNDYQQFLEAEPELVALPDQAATIELVPITVDVLGNDSHPEGGELTIIFAAVPNGQGTVSITDDQLVIYDPGSAFEFLALGETANVVVTYTISHPSGAIKSSTATVTVTGINQGPVIVPIAKTAINEQTNTDPLQTTVTVHFTDVDLSSVGHSAQVTSVVVAGVTDGLTLDNSELLALMSTGTVTKFAGEGSGSAEFEFSVGSKLLDYLAVGETLTLTYTVEIDDQDGGVTAHTFDVVITGTNDAPVIDVEFSDAVGTVVENGLDDDMNPVGDPDVSGQIDASDVDSSGLTFSFIPQAGKYGTFAISATGAWTYVLNDAAADHLALDQSDTDQFTVTVTDKFGAIDEVLVTLTVTGSNDAPVVSDVALVAVEDGLAVSGSFVGNDVDSDDGPASLVYTVVQPGEGTVINNGDGTFSFDPGEDFQDLAAGETRDVTFTYTATDSHGTVSEPATITVTVTGVGDGSVIGGVATGAVTEDASPATLTTGGALTIADPDAGQSNFAPQASTAGTYGTFTLSANGTWTYSANNTQSAIQSLGAGDKLTDSFTAVSSDGTASKVVTVTIHGINDVPAIGGTATGAVTEDASPSTLTTGGTLTISDADAGESSFAPQASVTGTYGTFTLSANGTWTYSASNTQSAVQKLGEGDSLTDSFTAVSSDGTATRTVTVTIHGTNDIPVVDLNGAGAGKNNAVTFTEDEAPVAIAPVGTLSDVDSASLQSMTVTLTDVPDGESESLTLTAQAQVAANGAGLDVSYDPNTGVLSITGAASLAVYQTVLRGIVYENTSQRPDPTDREITVVVNDGDDSSTVATTTVEVVPVPDPISFAILTVDDPNINQYGPGDLGTQHQRVFAIIGDGDQTLETGETAYRLSNNLNSEGGLLVDNDANDPVIITADGPLSNGGFGDQTNSVSFANSTGFGLNDLGGGESSTGGYLNDRESLSFQLTGGVLLAIVAFTVNALNASANVTIDVDGSIADDGFSLGTLSDGAKVVIDFVNGTITVNGTVLSGTAAFFNSAEGTDSITIGSTSVDGNGFAIKDLQLSRDESAGSEVFALSAAAAGNESEMLGAPEGGDGIAASDIDGSPTIEDGGDVSADRGEGGYADAPDVLASLDLNGDSVIDAADEAFADLLVWIDANQDGISQPDELVGLADLGIVSLDLSTPNAVYTIDGQTVIAEGKFTYADGSTSEYAAVEPEGVLAGAEGGQLFTVTDLSIHEVIVDYQAGDVIDLTRLGFELATGQLDAAGAEEFVSYDSAAGALFVDVDGSGGQSEFELAAEFATAHRSVMVRLCDGATTADVEIA